MGKHSHKSRGSSRSHTQDTSFLLTQPSRPKMADLMADTPCVSTLRWTTQNRRSFSHNPEVAELFPQQQPDLQWATKTDITAMVTEIKAYLASEIVVLKTDLSTLAGRMNFTEETVHSLGVKQDRTAGQLHEHPYVM
ncbi:Hypothetical predicted protein [Pelobates cultripes]|uniref:Uncharacterized protein n=1 Tax=Pelobates cultripes TaxID=61616 RepID=A0AAD1RVR8_PELCU|nr:Hypothetical predicted protein [Pelobates cultripes]